MTGNKQKYNPLLEDDLKSIWENLKDILNEIKGKTFFITGGTGFFGKWFLETFSYCNSLLDLNCNIIVLSRVPAKFLDEFPYFNQDKIKFYEGDIVNYHFPNEDIDYIIHGATSASVELNSNDPLMMLDTIINGTRRTLELAKDKKVKSLLYISSGAVYGKFYSDMLKVSEDYKCSPDCTEPLSAYGEGKRVGELLCSIYFKHFGVPAKIARCFAFVGPYLPLDKHFAVGNFILNALKNENIIVKGDGMPLRSYLYPTDLVTWLIRILIRGKNNYPYNVGSSKEISIGRLAMEISLITSGILGVKILIKSPKVKLAESYVPIVKKIETELGVQQEVNLQSALKKTINFHLKLLHN
ncbi:MAG: NAD-dependent epimerase/dehydratase family protein [Elusimicrobiota bacterium]